MLQFAIIIIMYAIIYRAEHCYLFNNFFIIYLYQK